MNTKRKKQGKKIEHQTRIVRSFQLELNVHPIGILERVEKEIGAEEIFE